MATNGTAAAGGFRRETSPTTDQLATIGHRAGVVHVGGLRFSGSRGGCVGPSTS